MDQTIDNLVISVTASADSAARNLDRLGNSVRSMGGSARSAGNDMSALGNETKKVGSTVQKAGRDASTSGRQIKRAGKDMEDAGKSAKKGTSGLSDFWGALKRIAFYRSVRFIIKSITEAFKAGISNLYQYSNAIDGHFAKSMDRLATSVLYLKNGLGTLAAPIIESLIPAIETIIDLFVDGINVVNQFIAAVKGESTYTAAKKYSVAWQEESSKAAKSVKDSVKEIKRTILGFDELNVLQKNNPSSVSSGLNTNKPSTDYSQMFEERPLTGILEKLSNVAKGWPDWLKWLLGVGGVVVGAALLKSLPGLIGKLFDALKRLISIHIPDWFRWLFGPKGDGDGGIDIPDNIKLPDADIKTNLEKGDWDILDDLSGKSVYLSPKLDNKPSVLLNQFIKGWFELSGRILYFTPKLDNRASVLYDAFRREWDSAGSKTLYFSPKMDNKASVLVDSFKKEFEKEWNRTRTVVNVYVSLQKNAWKSLASWIGNSLLVNVGLLHWGWENIEDWIGTAVTVSVALRKWGWSTLGQWTKADNGLYVNIGLMHWGWSTISDYIGHAVTVSVALNRWGWSSIESFVGTNISAAVNLYRGNFYSLNDWVGTWVDAAVYLVRGNFYSLADWVGNSVTVRVNLVMGNGGSININTNSNRSFGNASGGGGGSSGGGAGRGRRSMGGILSNGVWTDIPQYAGGTLSAGSLFLAGEAGPEIVGHVGGRTEVLNKSQLASAIYSAVQSAMAPAASNFAAAASSMRSPDAGQADYETLLMYIQRDSDAMARQNELLRQQNDYLRSINDKEWTAELTTAAVQRSLNRSNLRAGTTVVPVG